MWHYVICALRIFEESLRENHGDTLEDSKRENARISFENYTCLVLLNVVNITDFFPAVVWRNVIVFCAYAFFVNTFYRCIVSEFSPALNWLFALIVEVSCNYFQQNCLFSIIIYYFIDLLFVQYFLDTLYNCHKWNLLYKRISM